MLNRYRSLWAFLVIAVLGVTLARLQVRREALGTAEMLASIANEAAGGIDATAHARVQGREDAASPEFDAIVHHLRSVMDEHDISTPIYTLRPNDDRTASFVAMTNETPFVGDRYAPPSALWDAQRGEPAWTGIYTTATGTYVSGFAPIQRADGSVEAVVCVDAHADALASWRTTLQLLAVLLALVGAGVAWVAPALVSGGPIGGFRNLLGSSISVRIGLSGSAAVLAAVLVVGWLDHQQSYLELVENLHDRLGTTVRVAAPQIDVLKHQRVAESADPTSSDFLELRNVLRAVKENAQLDEEVYTFRRDGDRVRFVVMTNEVPYIGDPYELRPGLRRSFEQGTPGFDGPYHDAHGSWLSAWAPLKDASGQTVGVVQADSEITALISDHRNRSLRRLLFALGGCAFAFVTAVWTARTVARPIQRIASAARRIQSGDLGVEVEESGRDEVGQLAVAINEMTRGLRQREEIRDAFGKYVSAEFVQRLVDDGAVKVEGQLAELTVMESDIRGYTPLTEALGANEIVQLLNEYFAIVVEIVIAENGHVDKFMGDAMLCWFGSPIRPCADHQARATRAATRILERLAAWNAERVARGEPPVHTGIGIATGPVVVGCIGSPEKLEYTAIGEGVNVSARLCSKAEAGQVLVSEAVWAASGDDRFVRIGPIAVKGVSEPVIVHAFQVPGA
ncbi:MAG: adenylate/guanylate cyclase domain-containing protein [Myxococcota bacterium]